MAFDLASAKPAGGGFDLASAKPANAPEQTFLDKVKQQAGNIAAGAVRGAGSIGATVLAPVDYAMDFVDRGGFGDKVSGQTLSGLVTGEKKLSRNAQRRKDMDAALQSMGADTDSAGYQLAKLGTEVAGTWPVAGIVANGARAVGAAPALVNAIRTSGMSTGGAGGNMLTRMLGGSIAAGTTGAAISPEDAATSAAIGAVLPPSVVAAGKVTNALGRIIRGKEVSPEMQAAVKAAVDAGYVIPPTQAKPTLTNRLVEGMAGKLTTAQNASAKNAGVTNALAAKAIGLAEDTKITPEVLNDVRNAAGAAYRDVANLPVKPAQAADTLTNTPAMPEINPAQMVFDLRKARNDATAWFNSYARTADPDSLAKAKAAKDIATQLEGTLEGYAKSLGRDDLVADMVKSRQLIAKTYSVEKALNPTSGNVDARQLAKQLEKGKPLSGELKQAAEFAARFPKAAQSVEGMGSLPQTSPLDWAASGALSAATANPLAMLGVAARPMARAAALSRPVQSRLASDAANNQLLQLLSSPEAQQLIYRAAPPAISAR